MGNVSAQTFIRVTCCYWYILNLAENQIICCMIMLHEEFTKAVLEINFNKIKQLITTEDVKIKELKNIENKKFYLLWWPSETSIGGK